MKITKYENAVTPFEAMFDRLNWGFPMLGRFDRLFPDLEGEQGWAAVRMPRTNVHETDDAWVFSMEMPGLKRENVEINLEGDTLVVKGETSEKKEEKGLVRREYHAARFERAFNVAGIDRDKVKAKMEDGILTVTLPKLPEKVGKKIEVS